MCRCGRGWRPTSRTCSNSMTTTGRAASSFCFFFQGEDGIRYLTVTGVQTCALPIFGFYARDALVFVRSQDALARVRVVEVDPSPELRLHDNLQRAQALEVAELSARQGHLDRDRKSVV